MEWLQPSETFLAWLSNGRIYELLPRDLRLEAGTISGCHLGETSAYFVVELKGGFTYEVPWDLILHLCEPAYEYHLSTPNPDGRSTAKRIGLRVRDQRLAKGMTQSRLAGLIGFKESNLSRLEAGKHLPSLDTLEKVAEALQVSVASLIAE